MTKLTEEIKLRLFREMLMRQPKTMIEDYLLGELETQIRGDSLDKRQLLAVLKEGYIGISNMTFAALAEEIYHECPALCAWPDEYDYIPNFDELSDTEFLIALDDLEESFNE